MQTLRPLATLGLSQCMLKGQMYLYAINSKPSCAGYYGWCVFKYGPAHDFFLLFDLILYVTSSHQQSFSYEGTGLPGLNQY